jgi:cytochrome c oxidase cbb3-type subunit 3
MPMLKFAIAGGLLLSSALMSLAQDQPGTPQQQTIAQKPDASNRVNAVTATSGNLLTVPFVNNIPGGVQVPEVKSPVGQDPNAAQRGMQFFTGFNCVGCHAANGGGGMGPALSNSFFKFGGRADQIYTVISHGGPQGMPAWGTVLPDSVIWDIVAYIQSISQAPSPQWGTTVNLPERSPSIEQVPAEFMNTAKPWDHTQAFSSGQKPTSHNPTSVGVGAQPPEQQK